MKKIMVNGRVGLTTTRIPFSNGKYPVWFDDDPKNPIFINESEVVFVDTIKEIAESHHETISFCGLFTVKQICGCCGDIANSTARIEHDSNDQLKDKNVCSDCYSQISTYWRNNDYKKIPFLKSGRI